MSTLRSSCALVLMLTGTAASAAAQSYAQQGYDQQQQQYSQQQYQQYPQDQQYQQGQYQQQYPQQQQQQYQQGQQPPPGYFPTPDAQGAYNYNQQLAPGALGAQQGAGEGGPEEPLVSSVAGAFQISAGISLIQVNSLSLNQDMMAAMTAPPGMMVTPPAMGAAAVAPAAPVDPVVTTVGIVKQPVFLELGYGLAKNMVFGAIFGVSNTSESVNNGAIPARDFVFSFAPKFDYQFLPTSRLNPFIGGTLNVNYENRTYFGLKDTRMLFGLALRGGLRYFVVDGLSIDPSLSFGGLFGSGKQQNLGKTPNSNSEYSASAIHFAISMGVSVWIK